MILITFRNMTNTQQGSKTYLFSIVLTAVLGGLLFGYDTAVISGAEQGLRAFFMGASDFQLHHWHTWFHRLECTDRMCHR